MIHSKYLSGMGALVVVGCLSATTFAAPTTYATGFEPSPTETPGWSTAVVVNGAQATSNGWLTSTGNSFIVGPTGTNKVKSGVQSLAVGSGTAAQWVAKTLTPAPGNDPIVQVSVDFYLSLNTGFAAEYVSIQETNSSTGNFFYSITPIGRTGGAGPYATWNFHGSASPASGLVPSLTPLAWNNLKLTFDYAADTYTMTWNNTESFTAPMNPLANNGVDLAFLSQSASRGFGYYDNFSATSVIPEPTSLALLGLGGLAMLRRRRDA